jgi:hypothetical protein
MPTVNIPVTPETVIRELRILARYPVVYDEVQGADFFECPFCEGEGLFAVGNGGICHDTDCAVALAARITDPVKNFFDQLAYKSILHQLSQLSKYPEMRHSETNQWFPCCPFCHQFNQGQGMAHTNECIVTYAKQQSAA